MKKKMYCFNCDNYVEVTESKTKKNYTIHNKNLTIEEVCYYCLNCHEELIDETLDESLNLIYDKYLEIYNLSVARFKKIRQSLNLSQELFAKALGWSKKTIIRYELGQSLPQIEYLIKYQKLNENKDEIFNILSYTKNNLSTKDYYTIIKKINTTYNLKTIHTFLYILTNNPLYETQLMKHLFALDFETQKELKTTLTNLKYAHAPYGPIIDGKDHIINYLLKNNYIQLICTNDDKMKFIASMNYDSNLFTDQEINILTKVKNKLKNKTSNELSDWSHNFIGWQKTTNGEIIDPKEYIKDFDLEKRW